MAGASRTLPAWVALAALGAGLSLAWHTEAELSRERDLHGAPHAGAGECRRCHPDHHESWARTFHGRMTQPAREDTVLGRFDGRTLDYQGVRTRAERSPDGGFVFRYAPGYGPAEGDPVLRTVGSRRVQQYLAKRHGEWVRLPWAWHVQDQRFVHMNGAFLTPDPARPVSRGEFERHVTRWNDNCIFCHNVAPNPGKRAEGFDSEVAELGVACEACHGPATEHAALNQNPWRRYRLHLADGLDDRSVVNPADLSPERAADVCGRCHGQRKTDDIERFLTRGDPFVPGDDLARYSAPLWRDTRLNGEEGVFAQRFWPDGTPRLTAYEYQGLLQSPCSQRGPLTCTTCHGMHEGDPRGQLRPSRQGAALCTGCHDALEQDDAQRAHSGHLAGDAGCVDCHMPRIVYGVMDAHRSHRIESPDPARAAEQGRPDACTLCHVGRSRRWAAQAVGALGRPSEAAAEEEPQALAEVTRMLFAGDPVERALAARALGEPRVPAAERGPYVRQRLLEVMQNERYPAVRRLARRSLQRLWPEQAPHLSRFVAEGSAEERARFVAGSLRDTHLAAAPPDVAAQVEDLRAQAPRVEIHIGE